MHVNKLMIAISASSMSEFYYITGDIFKRNYMFCIAEELRADIASKL